MRSLHTKREYAAIGGTLGSEGTPAIIPALQHCPSQLVACVRTNLDTLERECV
jgi:hypothetical protein